MPALRTRDTLEVTTDAPPPPTLAIISPTPRAFTFPISSHNLPNSPYSSPSNSPFEPDLRPLALSDPTTPPSHLIRTLSPPSFATNASSSSSPPSSSNHKRRKSTSSTDVERRRPKKGDEDYIKRPENAFILFRRKCNEDRAAAAASSDGALAKKQRQADLSKAISQQWKALSADEKQYWEDLAKEKKKEHETLYPDYVFRPQRSKDKEPKQSKASKKSSSSKQRRDASADSSASSSSLSFVVPTGLQHGRSASAPTPPLPYQNIQIPNVYQMTPSCPTSPSLLPMISRRASAPGHAQQSPEEVMSNFDYFPPPQPPTEGNLSFGQGLEAIESSDFLRSMFNMAGSADQSSPASSDETISPSHTTTSQMISPASSIASSGPPSPWEFSGYAQNAWEGSGLWQQDPTGIIGTDDFDINAIPPIELGVPKYADETMHITPEYVDPMEYTNGTSYELGGYDAYGSQESTSSYQDSYQSQDPSYPHQQEVGFEEMMSSATY